MGLTILDGTIASGAIVVALSAVKLADLVIRFKVLPKLNGNKPPPTDTEKFEALERLQSIYPKMSKVSEAVNRVETTVCGPSGCANRQERVADTLKQVGEQLGQVAEHQHDLSVVIGELKGVVIGRGGN
jgi:hypothetical protein